MKTLGKRFIMASLALMLLQVPVFADNDRPISFSELPQTAQTIIKKHFANHKFIEAEVDKDVRKVTYEVELSNGVSLEFNKDGKWKEISCKRTAVPAHFIPQEIRRHVKKNWPKAKIVKIERENHQYEVELSSDIEITYNKNFKVLKIDK